VAGASPQPKPKLSGTQQAAKLANGRIISVLI
jgi:hypothetical protein